VVSCPRPVLRRLLLRAGRIPAHFLRQQQQLIHLRLLERLVLLLVLLLGCLEHLVLLFLLLERLLVVLYLAGASVKSTLADQLLLLLLHLFLDASVKCTAADQLLLRCPLRSLVALFASSLYRSCRATT